MGNSLVRRFCTEKENRFYFDKANCTQLNYDQVHNNKKPSKSYRNQLAKRDKATIKELQGKSNIEISLSYRSKLFNSLQNIEPNLDNFSTSLTPNYQQYQDLTNLTLTKSIYQADDSDDITNVSSFVDKGQNQEPDNLANVKNEDSQGNKNQNLNLNKPKINVPRLELKELNANQINEKENQKIDQLLSEYDFQKHNEISPMEIDPLSFKESTQRSEKTECISDKVNNLVNKINSQLDNQQFESSKSNTQTSQRTLNFQSGLVLSESKKFNPNIQ